MESHDRQMHEKGEQAHRSFTLLDLGEFRFKICGSAACGRRFLFGGFGLKLCLGRLGFSRLVSAESLRHICPMNSLRLRAVLYQEDGLWVAHALEMDLIGTGATESAALRELRGNVEAQLSFAAQEEMNPFRPAPPEIQALWEQTNLAAIGLGRSKAKERMPTAVVSLKIQTLSSR